MTITVDSFVVATDRDSVGQLADNVHGMVADYLAAGIDPQRSTIFAHSGVPALNQLMLPFLSLVSVAELQRNPTVKAEAEATGNRALSGLLLTYPVHQAADILFCHANLVPVGKDQLPHVEATRLIGLSDVLAEGNGRANQIAGETLDHVRQVMGMTYGPSRRGIGH